MNQQGCLAALFGLMAVVFAIGYVVQYWQVFLGLFILVGILAAVYQSGAGERAKRIAEHAKLEQERTRSKFQQVLSPHVAVLRRKRRQKLRTDDYGIEHREAWDKELAYFIAQVVKPALTPAEFGTLGAEQIPTLIEGALAEATDGAADIDYYRSDMTPTEYEDHCAALLRKAGWDARTTRGSGDQGVDVEARLEGMRVVVQCKHYSKPIGNAAVQEALAGKAFVAAQHAVVASNQPYTRAARELAASSSVLLLHHDELPTLGSLIRSGAGPKGAMG